jgi:aspartyl-tRNA(Asn)/glutamyl-tRNA(Gln) amidotransferase subunit A
MGRVAGPMTRTVRDAAMLLVETSRPDVRDFMSLPYQPVDYPEQLEGLAARGLRVGFLPDMGVGLPVHPEVRAAAQAAATALERAGAIVEQIPSFMTEAMLDGMQVFFEARSYNDVSALPDALLAKIHPFIVEWCTWRAGGFTGADVMNGYTQVMLMREAAVRAVAPFDFLISPTSPIPPYEAELPCPGDDPHDALPHIAFTVAYNMSEQPAASVNWSYTGDGLPIGVQVVGQRFDDLGVLRMSRLLEQIRPAQRSWPEPG